MPKASASQFAIGGCWHFLNSFLQGSILNMSAYGAIRGWQGQIEHMVRSRSSQIPLASLLVQKLAMFLSFAAWRRPCYLYVGVYQQHALNPVGGHGSTLVHSHCCILCSSGRVHDQCWNDSGFQESSLICMYNEFKSPRLRFPFGHSNRSSHFCTI